MSRRLAPRADAARPSPLVRLGENVIFGLAWGFILAVLFSLFVGLMALLRGSAYYTQYDTTTGEIIRSYFLAGLLAGSVFGFLRPLGQTRLGTTVLGMAVGPFVYGAVGATIHGWEGFFAFETVLPGLLAGGTVGFMLGKRGALG
ncbi:MAG TPA: hypothetical protein VEL76_13805 [Gemmataceae bacterium]|nr:hypothetical protein [Gemmataceae bacterium]